MPLFKVRVREEFEADVLVEADSATAAELDVAEGRLWEDSEHISDHFEVEAKEVPASAAAGEFVWTGGPLGEFRRR